MILTYERDGTLTPNPTEAPTAWLPDGTPYRLVFRFIQAAEGLIAYNGIPALVADYTAMVARWPTYNDVITDPALATNFDIDVACVNTGCALHSGRSGLFTEIEAATLDVTLFDELGLFDPRWESTILGPGRRVRSGTWVQLSVQFAGAWFPMFTGLVDGWERVIDAGAGSTLDPETPASDVRVSCTDAFTGLAAAVFDGAVSSQSTSARVVALYTGTWQSLWGGTSIATGTITLDARTLDNASVLNEIKAAAAVEDGRVFIAGDGTLTFQTGAWRASRNPKLTVLGLGARDFLTELVVCSYNRLSSLFRSYDAVLSAYLVYDDLRVCDPTGGRFSDNFTRADPNTLGAPWVAEGGSIWGTIAPGYAYARVLSAPDDWHTIATIDAGTPDIDVSVTLVTIAAATGVIVRFSDVDNYVYFGPNSGDGSNAVLVKTVNGSAAQMADTGVIINSGDRVRVVVTGDTYTLRINGIVVGTVTDPFNRTATKIGMMTNYPTSRFDGFIGTYLGLSVIPQVCATKMSAADVADDVVNEVVLSYTSPAAPTNYVRHSGAHVVATGPQRFRASDAASIARYGLRSLSRSDLTPNPPATTLAALANTLLQRWKSGDATITAITIDLTAEAVGHPTLFALWSGDLINVVDRVPDAARSASSDQWMITTAEVAGITWNMTPEQLDVELVLDELSAA